MNAFTWNTGQASIFATAAALRYAKSAATIAAAQTKIQNAKPKRPPKIRIRKSRATANPKGRPGFTLDVAELLKLRAEMWSLKRLGVHFNCNGKTIARALTRAAAA